jgi:signal transduction histidine kinase
MDDLLLVAVYAAASAAAVGLLGVLALRGLRRRSLSLSVAVVAVMVVAAMVAGTAMAAWAKLVSSQDLRVVIVMCGIAGAASLVAALLLGRQVAAGSKALIAAARALGEGDACFVPGDPPTAELTELGREWATTSAKLAASRERERALDASRRELVAWVSHDLRAPLTGLRAMAEALEDGMVYDPTVYYARIRVEVERLSDMVGDLFELSRLHAGVLPLALSCMSTYDLVDDALAGAHPLAREHGVRLVGDAVDPVPIEVDGREMTRVIANLLVNAINFTPAEGTVAVAARREADSVVLSVTDGCGGIPAEDLARVFDTGWRGAGVRTAEGGAGLGLAIVRGIVEAHSGRTAVRNVPGGCRFEVVLPAAARA